MQLLQSRNKICFLPLLLAGEIHKDNLKLGIMLLDMLVQNHRYFMFWSQTVWYPCYFIFRASCDRRLPHNPSVLLPANIEASIRTNNPQYNESGEGEAVQMNKALLYKILIEN